MALSYILFQKITAFQAIPSHVLDYKFPISTISIEMPSGKFQHNPPITIDPAAFEGSNVQSHVASLDLNNVQVASFPGTAIQKLTVLKSLQIYGWNFTSTLQSNMFNGFMPQLTSLTISSQLTKIESNAFREG